MTTLDERLYSLAAIAQARGWTDASGWIMAHMAREEKAAKSKRKRKAYVAHPLIGRRRAGGEVWVTPQMIRDAEASAELDRDCTQWEGKDGDQPTE